MKTIKQIKQDFSMVQNIEEITEAFNKVKSLNPKRILEIGVERGGSLQCWANCIEPPGYIVGVDHQDKVSWDKFKTDNFIYFVEAYSKDAIQDVIDFLEGNPLDFLFIDGDHSYNGVKLDFELYSPLVKHKGIIGFHDIKMDLTNKSGVSKFWNELKGKKEEIIGSTNSIGIGLWYKE